MTTTTSPQKSTIVRTTDHRLRAIRGGLAVTQRVAPPMAARWAARLWCVLPAGRSRRIDRRPSAGRLQTVSLPGGRSFVAESWGEGAPIYLVHGWGGWRGQLGALVSPLVDAGYQVIAYDAPSHGDAAPGVLGRGRSTALEMAEAVHAVSRRFGPPAGLVAHSLGAVAVVVAMGDGLSVPRVAFVAPTVSPMVPVSQFAAGLGLATATRDGMVRRLETIVGRPLRDFDALADVPGSRPPALIVHDRDDREIPYDEATRLIHGWPESELVTTEGLGHHRLLGDPMVIGAVTEYLARR